MPQRLLRAVLSRFPASAFRAVVPPLLLLAAAVIFLSPVLVSALHVVVGSADAEYADAVSMFYPLRSFANAELQQGRLPLWNPYTLCGYSLHGEGQAAIFNPVNLLLAPLPPQLSMNLFALVHFVAAGALFFGYLRACGAGRFSAFFGGFVYLFSSGPISRLFAGHYTMIPFLALVPGLMWGWEAWRRKGSWSAAAWSGVALGGMALAGFPPLLLYASIYLGWHVLAEVLGRWRREGRRAALHPLAYLLAVLALGAGIGAVQLFPSYAFAKESFRQHAGYEMAATFSFSPENLVTLLFPRFFGEMGGTAPPYWGRHLLWENWIYVGVVPLALAVVPLFRNRKSPAVAHAAAALVFVTLALGTHTPLHRLFYDYVPFFAYFRGSARFSFFVLFSLVTLAGLGCDSLLREGEPATRGRSRLAAAVLGTIALLGAATWLTLGARSGDPGAPLDALVQWRLAQGETYIHAPFFQYPDLALVWAQLWPQVARTVAVALVGCAVFACWPLLKRRPRLACAALCLATFPDLWQFAGKESFTAPLRVNTAEEMAAGALRGDPARSRILAPDLPRNALLPHRVQTPLGYVGNTTRRYNGFLTAVNGVDRSAGMLSTPVVRLSPGWLWPAVNYLLVDARVPVPAEFAAPVGQEGAHTLYRLPGLRPRAEFPPEVTVCGSFEEALAALESGSVDLSAAPLLETPAGMPLPEVQPPVAGDAIEILESMPARTVIETRAAGRRLLVLADGYDSGWRCRLEDGSPVEIYPVNVAFRGVPVPPGRHVLTFSYEPVPFYAGAVVSAVTVAGVVACGLRRGALRRRAGGGPSASRSAQPTGGSMPKSRIVKRHWKG